MASDQTYTIHFIVENIPASTPPQDYIYISGDFCGWFPDLPQYRLKKNKFQGFYEIIITVNTPNFAYKFVRGDWSRAECLKNGGSLENRTYDVFKNGNTLIIKQIENWEDKRPTASKQVSILAEAFHIPQLNRRRRIWLYLPPDYQEGDKSYPVLYMHDGQNLFSELHAYAGEWAVDKTLNQFAEQDLPTAIVVGIENGGHYRRQEYVPWSEDSQADDYARFLVETLKPYIDQNYRTKTEPKYTGLMGSSFGALFSFYAGLKYPETFGRIGAFSPSFWTSNTVFDFIQKIDKPQNMRIVLLAGLREGEHMVKNVDKAVKLLKIMGFTKDELQVDVKHDGQHNEWFWRREFPHAFQFLFQQAHN